MNFKKGFTLAEVMIVLVVIGILTGIVVPIMVNSAPKQKYMKFKKAHTTLGNVVRELVNSDQYYKDGDLGIRLMSDGSGRLLDGTHSGDYSYFCNSIADVLSTKTVNCTEDGRHDISYFRMVSDIPNTKTFMDYSCKRYSTSTSKIITSDDVVWYDPAPRLPFGIAFGNGCDFSDSSSPDNDGCKGLSDIALSLRLFNGGSVDSYGFQLHYKLFCIDIDGINQGENPFAYAIRADGKILTGARVDEWLAKDFNGKDPSEQE